MKKFAVCILVLSMVGVTVAKEVEGKSYTFSIPDEVSFTINDQMEMYTFQWGTPPEFGLFMLMGNPAPVPEAAVPSMVDMMTITFKAQMEKQPGMKVLSTDQKSLEAGLFKGTEVAFTVEHEAGTMKQYMLILFDGEQAWNGQLTGMGTNDIEKVYSILKSAKHKSDTLVE